MEDKKCPSYFSSSKILNFDEENRVLVYKQEEDMYTTFRMSRCPKNFNTFQFFRGIPILLSSEVS